MKRRLWPTLLSMLLISAGPLWAQQATNWQGKTDNANWFDEENWTSGFPMQGSIANITDGEVGVFPGQPTPQAFILTIARQRELQEAQAKLNIEGQDLLISNRLVVADATFGLAQGDLSLLSNPNFGGGILHANQVTIGQATGKGGQAIGNAFIQHQMRSNTASESNLTVGRNANSEMAHGHLIVPGTIGNSDLQSGYASVNIGQISGVESGEAVGTVSTGGLFNAGGELTVGLNTSARRTSYASGTLNANAIDGYDLATFGASEVGVARADVTVQSFYGVQKTILGSPNSRGRARLVFGPETNVEGEIIAIHPGSVLTAGGGTKINAEVFNEGRIGILPDENKEQFGQLQIRTLQQTDDGIFEFNIGGEEPIFGYQQLLVTEGIELAGSVHLTFENDFIPEVGQQFQVIDSPRGIDLARTAWKVTNPPKDVAFEFQESEGLVVQVVSPRTLDFVSADGGDFRWTDQNIWTDRRLPKSFDDITMLNTQKTPQRVRATPGAITRRLTIDGTLSAMELNIPRGVKFMATHDIRVMSQGQITLEGGAALLADQVKLEAGSALVAEGQLTGNLANEGLVRIGVRDEPTQLNIDGSFSQLPLGYLEMGVFGTEDGEFDQLLIDGIAELDGTLVLDIDFDKLLPNARIPLLTATDGISGNFRLKLPFGKTELPLGLRTEGSEDSDGGMQMIFYSGGGPGILGDMNWDLSVDECDFDAFALALQNPAAYASDFGFEPGLWADINDDGEFDVDDIGPFYDLVSGVSCEAVVPLPEPTSHVMLTIASLMLLTVRRRPTRLQGPQA